MEVPLYEALPKSDMLVPAAVPAAFRLTGAVDSSIRSSQRSSAREGDSQGAQGLISCQDRSAGYSGIPESRGEPTTLLIEESRLRS